MLMPNSLAILGQSFSGEAKGRAIGIWAATGATAGAIKLWLKAPIEERDEGNGTRRISEGSLLSPPSTTLRTMASRPLGVRSAFLCVSIRFPPRITVCLATSAFTAGAEWTTS
jgi:hypothetical protein